MTQLNFYHISLYLPHQPMFATLPFFFFNNIRQQRRKSKGLHLSPYRDTKTSPTKKGMPKKNRVEVLIVCKFNYRFRV